MNSYTRAARRIRSTRDNHVGRSPAKLMDDSCQCGTSFAAVHVESQVGLSPEQAARSRQPADRTLRPVLRRTADVAQAATCDQLPVYVLRTRIPENGRFFVDFATVLGRAQSANYTSDTPKVGNVHLDGLNYARCRNSLAQKGL